MTLKPIKTEEDYNQVLERIEQIFDAEPNSKKAKNWKYSQNLLRNTKMNIFQFNHRTS